MDPTNKQILDAVNTLDKFVRSSTKFDTFTLAITIISFVFLIVGSSYTIYQVVRLHKLFQTAVDDAAATETNATNA